MLVYDAQNEESQQKVDSLKIEINTAQQLQGKKPSIFVVENRSNSTGNCSPMKVFKYKFVVENFLFAVAAGSYLVS